MYRPGEELCPLWCHNTPQCATSVLLLTTKVSIICLAIKPPEMEPATDQRKANVIYAALVLIHFINWINCGAELPTVDTVLCLLWDGLDRAGGKIFCNFADLFAAGCWRPGLARLAECPIIQILKASVSSLILFSFPPFGQTGAEKININEAGSLLFSDYIWLIFD